MDVNGVGAIVIGGVPGWGTAMARMLARNGAKVAIFDLNAEAGKAFTPRQRGLPPAAQESLGKQVPHRSRLGHPDEYAQLVESIVANPMLNCEVIRLEQATAPGARQGAMLSAFWLRTYESTPMYGSAKTRKPSGRSLMLAWPAS